MTMKIKAFGLAVVAALAVAAALGASSTSATTLEESGITKNSVVLFGGALKSGTTMSWTRTDGSLGNTCTSAGVQADTEEPFTSKVSVTAFVEFSFSSCERTVTVHSSGTLHISHINTTDGTVSSSGTEVTVGTPFGHINCKTGGGVDIGTLTGKASGYAEIDVNAVINCGFLVPSATWKGTYTITTPTGLGVSA